MDKVGEKARKYAMEHLSAEKARKLFEEIESKGSYWNGYFNSYAEAQEFYKLLNGSSVSVLRDDYAIAASTSEVTDGKIVGGEGRSWEGIPYGLYQEGGRSYRGFEITSEDNGLRKGVYRFYALGGGTVDFGNSARDGQFTENQFQKLIGEGKIKLLDSVSVSDAAVNCNKFEILAKESGANFHNISNTKKDGVTYMKFVSSAPEAEQERSVNWLRSVLEGQEGSGVLSWGMRGTSRGEMSVMIKDAEISQRLVLESIKDYESWVSEVEVEGVPNGLMDTLKYACSREGANYNKAVAEIKRLIKSGTSPLKAFDKVYAECSIDSVYKKYRGLNDTKMFKVVDKATGKTLLVKATDSMAAVQRVSSLKDVDHSSYSKQLDKIRRLMEKQRKIESGGHTDMELMAEIRNELRKVPNDIEEKNDLMFEFGWGY